MSKVVIIGGGTAGISAAAKLLIERSHLSLTIVDPADLHYYQPLWTLVGAGICSKEQTAREMKKIIPNGVDWIQDSVVEFKPDQNQVLLQKASEPLHYDYLIVCPGIQIDWDKVTGLKETLGKNGVCSNYSYETVDGTWKALQETKRGPALFTYPHTPVKCGGAPQKIMYLAEEFFREQRRRDRVSVEFITAGDKVFGVPKYKAALEKIIQERGIETTFLHQLVKVEGEKKVATFKNLQTGELVEREFGMLHAVPPMSAPDFIKTSPLANAEGWVDVDKYTTQHNRYLNVFSVGDASSLPTSKTGAAIRKEVPVMVSNMLSLMDGRQLEARYSGYTSCPLVTGKGKLILAEFDYDGNPMETFPFDQAKERYSMYLLKRYGLPLMYWNGMLKGRMM